jgi:hypothetical protein
MLGEPLDREALLASHRELAERLEVLRRLTLDELAFVGATEPEERLELERIAHFERLKVWGCSKDRLTNVVDVYIRRLRRKVDHDAPTPLIQTVRGFGYKIRSPSARAGAARGVPPSASLASYSRRQLDSGSSKPRVSSGVR